MLKVFASWVGDKQLMAEHYRAAAEQSQRQLATYERILADIGGEEALADSERPEFGWYLSLQRGITAHRACATGARWSPRSSIGQRRWTDRLRTGALGRVHLYPLKLHRGGHSCVVGEHPVEGAAEAEGGGHVEGVERAKDHGST